MLVCINKIDLAGYGLRQKIERRHDRIVDRFSRRQHVRHFAGDETLLIVIKGERNDFPILNRQSEILPQRKILSPDNIKKQVGVDENMLISFHVGNRLIRGIAIHADSCIE
ncbi:hypothetical protein HUU40_27775 [candidate division KSB1 bacterium]|nr:hypothetical protein [candidate division KSB1 bacterium]